jgi:hypothetical protein
MYRIYLLIICVTISVPFIWSCTLFAHPTKKVEDGLEFLPLCPQVRKTQQALDTYLKLKNPLPASPKNIFAGQTLFYFDPKPMPCNIFISQEK